MAFAVLQVKLKNALRRLPVSMSLPRIIQLLPLLLASSNIGQIQSGARKVIPFYHPIKIVTSQYRCCKRARECCGSWQMRQMSPVCKMADNGRLTVDQKVKVVLFYAETKECSTDSETFSCTLWYKVGSLQTGNLQIFIRNNFPSYED